MFPQNLDSNRSDYKIGVLHEPELIKFEYVTYILLFRWK